MLLTMFSFAKRNVSTEVSLLTSKVKAGEHVELCIHQFSLSLKKLTNI